MQVSANKEHNNGVIQGKCTKVIKSRGNQKNIRDLFDNLYTEEEEGILEEMEEMSGDIPSLIRDK